MKKLMKPFWALARPLRTAIRVRLEEVITSATAKALETSEPARRLAEEVSLVLDAVVSEQIRLREQVEALEAQVHTLLEARFEPASTLIESRRIVRESSRCR
jgi:hypothetical protein